MENCLKKIRKQRNMSQYKLAELANTTPQHIGRLEKGECRLTTEWIERLSIALNVSIHELIGVEQTQEKYPLTTSDQVILSEDKFLEIISTAFEVFIEYSPKENLKIKDIGQKMAEICLSATKANTTDRKGQLEGMVINLYTKKTA